MNILYINTTSLMGQRFNGLMLGQQLTKQGHNFSQMVRPSSPNSDCLILRLLTAKEFRNADIVHLHLIYPQFLGLWWLPLITRLKPMVWTIHDCWPFTGHCVYPGECDKWQTGCGQCPDLMRTYAIKHDTTQLLWQMKKIAYDNSRFSIVTASPWMTKKICQSPLLKSKPRYEIPFGLDLKVYQPLKNKQKWRWKLKIPDTNFVIGYRPTPLYNKGYDYFRASLKYLKNINHLTILLFGVDSGLLNEFRPNMQIIDLGWHEEEDYLINAYNTCDIFAMPSMEESFGLMAIEAMACGIPVVVFTGTALPDTIHGSEGGMVVNRGSAPDLAKAFNKYLNHPSFLQQAKQSSRKVAKKYYTINQYVSKHLELYSHVLS